MYTQEQKDRFLKLRSKSKEQYDFGTEPEENKRYICIKQYSNNQFVCACCAEGIYDFLCIDHINGDGAKHRRKLVNEKTSIYTWLVENHFPIGFQVLCYNCNLGKRNKKDCPHLLKSKGDPLQKKEEPKVESIPPPLLTQSSQETASSTEITFMADDQSTSVSTPIPHQPPMPPS